MLQDKKVFFLALVPLLLLPLVGQAEDAPIEALPTVLHVPPSTIRGGSTLTLEAVIEQDWKLDSVWARVRVKGEQEYQDVAFERSAAQTFVAQIPSKLTQPPSVEYYIVSRDKDGGEKLHFASQGSPHTVVVRGDTEASLKKRRLAQYDDKRSSFRLKAEGTIYGRRLKTDPELSEPLTSDPFSDRFLTTEFEYTYRVLTLLHDIRFGMGLLRGQRSTLDQGGQEFDLTPERNQPQPGLNYGWSEANFEFHRNFSLGTRLILGASEEGFAAGVGGVFRIGQISGTHLAVGGQLLQDAGNMGFMSFVWDTVPSFPMALTIEVTERPDADLNPLGTRMLYDIGWNVGGGLTLNARVGYAARTEGLEGGPVVGLGATFER